MPARPRLPLRAAAGLALVAAVAGGAAAVPEPPRAVVALPLPYAGPLGGWSGIDVSPDGARFWAVTDAGRRTSGRLLREGGVLTGIDAPPPRRLPGLQGRAEIGEDDDAEGIDVDPETGEVWVSFEGVARLRRYAGPDLAAYRVADIPPAFRPAGNAGFEALARDRQGRAHTLPERPEGGYGPVTVFPLYRFDPATGEWHIAARLTHDKHWLAVGADFGPDGGFYLLERRFSGLGFASRIRRFELAARSGLIDGTTVYRSPTGRHGNLEGIGLWRDAEGALRAVMVADDNHKAYQRSQIVEVTLAPEAAGQ